MNVEIAKGSTLKTPSKKRSQKNLLQQIPIKNKGTYMEWSISLTL